MALSRRASHSEALGFSAVLASASQDPRTVGIFSDFDGTLSHLIDDPSAVVPVAGAVEVIGELAELCGRVAVVSGRPVSFLDQFFGAPAELSGLYGIEHKTAADGLTVDPAAAQWPPVLAQISADATERFGAGVVEDKNYSLTLHYRNLAPDVGNDVMAWCDAVAEEHGLHARAAKMSVELHPPVDRDKGDAIEAMFAGLDAAVYFGDDVGDRSAFERIQAGVEAGTLKAGASVLVNGAETPAELVEVTTDEVHTPDEAVELLNELLRSAS